ncbi:MAG: hypothetical protein HY465_02860, partial [Deltaproteobacteria bacterium]|nr:hypothetical protein [Deltaproteobacteria bacterium]
RFGVTWAPGSFPKTTRGNVSSGGSGAGLLGEAEGTGRTLLGFVINLLPKLRLAREQGDARVLEHSSLIVKDGERGELFSGTEIPFLNGEKTEFKQVGITLETEPIAVGSSVDLKIAAKLSAPSASLDGGIDLHRVTTTAVCRSGESLVLGNVIRDGDIKMKNRFPKDIDTSTALFSLVASRDFQSQRSEFLIFVMPTIITAPKTADTELAKWLEREDDVIRDRSQSEYRDHLRDQGLLPERRSATPLGKRGRRWR